MLRDGMFIRENPPKIGAHYVPKFYRTVTQSDRVVEHQTRWRNFYERHLSSLEVGAWLVVFYILSMVIFAGLRGIYNALFG